MITPVLLCGGSGTRLWPLSRKSYPKQFARLTGERTLFQASAERLAGPGFHAPLVLTGNDFRFIVTEQLSAVGITPGAVIIEPGGRNTAPAVLASALWLERTDPDGLMLVAPTDHVIPDAPAFLEAVAAGVGAAGEGNLVTFGIRPDRAETGYGYLEPDGDPDDLSPRPLPLRRFIEKPDREAAERMSASGGFLWNSGIFLFSARTVIGAFRRHCPDLVGPVRAAVDGGERDLGFLRLDPAGWAGVGDISFDRAVMERAGNLSVVPYAGGWSDLGGWDSVRRGMGPDADGVVRYGNATAIDCRDSMLRSEDGGLEIVGIGLEGVIAVAMPDAVLVAGAGRSQDVRRAVAALEAKGARQAGEFPKSHRPWGWFESLVTGGRFQVKRIHVHPGAALSLQSHHHRSEHWIVVRGTARVTVDDRVRLVTENESVYIPLGAVHRLENPGKVPLVLIEIQTGSYLGEDDIIRYEDMYART